MGCDIHMYVEKKDKNGIWDLCHGENYSYLEPFNGYCYGGRNYTLFGALAEVRRKVPDALKPKGFPEDASEDVLKEFKSWEGDAHTPSYLTLKDALPIFNKYGSPHEQVHSLFEDYLNPTKEELELFYIQYGYSFTYGLWFGDVNEKEIEDYRIVLWFDN